MPGHDLPASRWPSATAAPRTTVVDVAAGDARFSTLVAAVKAMCTVGEISDVYREAFGQYRDPAWL